MIISLAAEHSSSELLVLPFRGPGAVNKLFGPGRTLSTVLGELVQTTAGEPDHPPTDALPNRCPNGASSNGRLSRHLADHMGRC